MVDNQETGLQYLERVAGLMHPGGTVHVAYGLNAPTFEEAGQIFKPGEFKLTREALPDPETGGFNPPGGYAIEVYRFDPAKAAGS